MQIRTEINTYLDIFDKYGKVINAQYLIIAKSGAGKSMFTEAIAEKYHKHNFLTIVIADPKDELEFCYQMFPARENYHIQQLRKIGKKPEGKPLKIYHPHTFSIPNTLLPEMNLFTLSLKDISREGWSLLAETEFETETIRLLLKASNEITKEDGLYGLVHYIQNSIKGKKTGKIRKADPKNFYLESGSGTLKTITEISNYLQPFKRDYFLAKDSCHLNLNWKELLQNQEHYHVFVSNWIEDKKLKSFLVFSLLEGIIKNKRYLKTPVIVVIPEVRVLCKYKPQGFAKFLSEAVKNCLSLMRSSGKGMTSILDSQSFSSIDKDVRDSSTVTMLGELGPDVENVSKVYSYKREIKEQLMKMDSPFSFLWVGEESSGSWKPLISSSMHSEPHYVFQEIYQKECPEKMKKYTNIIEMMKKDYKNEETKFKDKIKQQEKREKEEKRKRELERIEREKGSDDTKDKKIIELKYKSLIEKMKRCWEFRQKNPDMSIRKSAIELGFPISSGNKTFKKYIEQYQEILDKEKETENNKDFEEKVIEELNN